MFTQLGSELRLLRQARGLRQRDVAEVVHVSRAFLSQVESGYDAPPSEAKLRELAEVLGGDPDKLLALAGKLPTDLHDALVTRPDMWPAIRLSATR
jgi:HTH-type transcriptional regulator, competence development regulator